MVFGLYFLAEFLISGCCILWFVTFRVLVFGLDLIGLMRGVVGVWVWVILVFLVDWGLHPSLSWFDCWFAGLHTRFWVLCFLSGF